MDNLILSDRNDAFKLGDEFKDDIIKIKCPYCGNYEYVNFQNLSCKYDEHLIECRKSAVNLMLKGCGKKFVIAAKTHIYYSVDAVYRLESVTE
jgi:hypothetical protein